MTSREIKFRAWDNIRNEMREVREIHYDAHGGMDVYCSGDDHNARALGSNALMQFTGLKDKNGKEIYEGDILSFNGKTGLRRNAIVWNEKSACFNPSPKSYSRKKRIFEVIGNIYENSELLTNK